MAFNGGTMVLGPVVARAHLGGPAAWGAITAADAFGLIVGGLISLRYTPRRPMLFVVLTGGTMAIPPLALALVLPLPAICFVAFSIGALAEVMMVQWTVQMATRIPADKLARVSSYDALGSMAAMPIGALAAGPLAAGIGVSATQFAAAAVIVVASAFTLIPRDIWTIRNDDGVRSVEAAGGDVAVDGDLTVPDAVLGTGSVLDRTGAIASAQAGADLG
jgi:predicted MFS family arabinose efflux permease